MDTQELMHLLEAVASTQVRVDDAAARIRQGTRTVAFARLDQDRELRCGFPEVILCDGKTPKQAAILAAGVLEGAQRVLLTRASPDHARVVTERLPAMTYKKEARILHLDRSPRPPTGLVAVLSGGSADFPVAEEAACTAEALGARVARVHDVGVAGLERLLEQLPLLGEATVFVAVAGMEGALPSVVAGLVDRPVIGVPTSVGYGAGARGLAALLAMLNSCAAGLTVVNIDNGFSAGYAAGTINRLASLAVASGKREAPASCS